MFKEEQALNEEREEKKDGTPDIERQGWVKDQRRIRCFAFSQLDSGVPGKESKRSGWPQDTEISTGPKQGQEV